MNDFNMIDIESIVKNVVKELTGNTQVAASVGTESTAKNPIADIEKKIMDIANLNMASEGEFGVFDNMNDAIEHAWLAEQEYRKVGLDKRTQIIEAFKDEVRKNVEEISRRTFEETGMGRYEDKVLKNNLALDKTPGVEDLEAGVKTGDGGLTLYEMSPFGVIGAIAPSTNPTETIINNGISMLAAGNTVVFSPHPGAKDVSVFIIQLINKAIEKVNGPKNLIVTVRKPSIESTNIMLSHPNINMICATGGPGIVKIALSSGKKAIGAGAGNPPVVVDETADIEKAAVDIIDGCSFDNNLPCICEKEVIVVDKVADYLKTCMSKYCAIEITDKNVIKQLEKLVLTENGTVNKKFVGKNADYIMSHLGINIDPSIRVVFAEVDKDHPFAVEELMMPILPIIRVRNIDEAIDLGVKLEHGNRHTAIMHSKHIDNLSKFAKAVQTTIFVKNAPSYAGIGYGAEGHGTFTIAGPTGEGLTSAKTFTRKRRCVMVDNFSIK
ncbi:aldehyde dehydrogenase family protein [Clostridium weizhouense]|uniref:Aldehyde dehydrogenase EutE n=1 Tax=Clostridium weizhouense TaxID=2859781 RepID=A0ABS7ALG5_9CLOT|nr:aldehyde dehydrogenase family protein [Clostridium weizhouense]MBW6409502.1 aldehyde dehydrogenase EutE [Clostridium weizhouense]